MPNPTGRPSKAEVRDREFPEVRRIRRDLAIAITSTNLELATDTGQLADAIARIHAAAATAYAEVTAMVASR